MKLRTKDFNGFTPPEADENSPTVESFDEQLAATRERLAKTQDEFLTNLVQIIYELGRLRGIVEERNRERM